MIALDINPLIGKNLRRIRKSHSLSQSQLARIIGTTPARLSSYETGRDGMGKDYMERVCQALHVEPWEFYVTDRTPIVKDEQEQEALNRFRRAQSAGVAEDAADYVEYRIAEASKRGKSQDELIKEGFEKLGQTIERKFGKTLQKKKIA